MTAQLAAKAILAQQTPDGAITMQLATAADNAIITYFSCFAAQGLVAAYRDSHDPKLIEAAKKWVDWYTAHQNPDGTINDYKGHTGAWKSTGTYDSSDSYAAVYLELLWDIQQAVPNTEWLKQRRESIELALAGIRLTMQPSGMTNAKPDYPVMYTMDNVETLRGLRAAVRLAKMLGDEPMALAAKMDADKMEAAISDLQWDTARSSYRIGVQTDGGKMEGLSKWYPDVMANLMAIAWLPPSERNRALFTRLCQKFEPDIPKEAKTMDDLGRLIWWGWAAKGAGDTKMLADIRARLANFGPICANGCDPGDLGHIARLTTD